jgi:hypothetical protein
MSFAGSRLGPSRGNGTAGFKGFRGRIADRECCGYLGAESWNRSAPQGSQEPGAKSGGHVKAEKSTELRLDSDE